MEKTKFSVCIPNYNYATYIGQTIQSVLDQDYSNFEILIADNASTDGSVQLIRSYNDPRIKLHVNRFNVGFAPNLDKACDGAVGDYMILLSSDDLMKPTALSTFAKVIEKYDGLNDPLVVVSSIDIIDENNSIKGRRYALIDQIVNGLKADNKFIQGEIGVYWGYDLLRYALSYDFTIIGRFLSTCYSRQLFEKVEGYSSIMSIMPDAFFSHKLMFMNPKTIVVTESLFSYRVHSTNNYSSIYKHVRLATDAYLMTILYSDEVLKPEGLSMNILRKNFTQYWGKSVICNSLLNGRITYGLKVWHFVWASYPKLYRKKILAWIFPFTIPLGWLMSLLLKIYYLVKGRSGSLTS